MDGTGEAVLRRAVRHVSMADVDAAGVLYFASPYRWMEELFSGWLRDLGHPLVDLLHGQAVCPCVSSCARYPAPAVVDDELEVVLVPTSIGVRSFGLAMIARRTRDAVTVVHAGEWHVWTTFGNDGNRRTLTPAPLPRWLRDSLVSVHLREPPRCPSASASPMEGNHAL